MTGETRSRNGCWTCRARRKKCDESRPHCSQCLTLCIECHGYGVKPYWMDGGAKERAEIDLIKTKVAGTTKKRKAKDQRPFQHYRFPSPPQNTQHDKGSSLDSGNTCAKIRLNGTGSALSDLSQPVQFSVDTTVAQENEIASFLPVSDFADTVDASATNNDFFGTFLEDTCSGFLPSPVSPILSHQLPAAAAATAAPSAPPLAVGATTMFEFDALTSSSPLILSRTVDSALGLVSLQDSKLLVYFLQEVQPWQFRYHSVQNAPFNKDWLFLLILQNRPLYSAVLALSSFHMSHQPRLEVARLVEYDAAERYTRAIQDFQAFHNQRLGQRAGAKYSDHLPLLLCNIMFMFLDVLHGGKQDGRRHLQAALSIIGPYCQNSQPTTEPEHTRNSPPMNMEWHGIDDAKNPVTGFLMWTHVLSSFLTTSGSTGMSAEICERYTGLLESPFSGLDLENITGCQNWVLTCILSIYTLREWKDRAVATESLSLWELLAKARMIRDRLENKMMEFSSRVSQYRQNNCSVLSADNPISPTASFQREKWAITRVFALATKILLEVSVSGPYPSISEIEKAVSQIKEALDSLPSPHLLQYLSWPICIAACMAQPAHYSFFTGLCSSTESPTLGILPTVLKAAQGCWSLRETQHGGRGIDWCDSMRSLRMDLIFM